MAYKDLREYIARLEEEGEVQRIEKEVDWNLEVGAIIRRSYDLKAPAPLFEKLKDYPLGYRIFGASMAASNRPNCYYARIAISMGMKSDSSAIDIMEEYIKRKRHPIKPILVSNGPCQENVHLNDEVNLHEFPAPLLHEGDGGRYIGTWHAVITKDPDTGWVNWGMYRLMIHDRKKLGGMISPQQHIGFHYYRKYEEKNRTMEFAAVFGAEPITPLISAVRLPAGVNEADIVGAIRGKPLEMVKCQTVDLEVPAFSEIVIEGEVLPYEREYEGPFGEYTGYRGGLRAPRPVFYVKAITHRNDPILPVCCEGVPTTDSHTVTPLTKAAEILYELREKGFPVKMVWRSPEGVGHLAIVSTRVPFPNYATHLANAIWSTKAGSSAYYLIIVEDDIDVTNRDEVIWALTTRCHPDKGIFKMPNTPGGPLDPFLSPYEREHHMGAHVLFDCTWPKDWPKEAIPVKASFDVLWPKEIQDRVLKNWKEYGYKE